MVNMTYSDKISIAGTLIAFFGFLLVIWQISITNKQIRKTEINQRAQFLAELQDRANVSEALASVPQEGQSTVPYWLQTGAIAFYLVVLLVLYFKDGKNS